MKKFLSVFVIVLGIFVFVGCAKNDEFKKDLTTYNMQITFNESEKTIDVKQKVNFVNKTDTTLNNLKLHLYPNAFRENAKAKVVNVENEKLAYPNGKSYGNIKILNVENNNKKLDFNVGGEDENILNIPLKKQLFPNDRFVFDVDFKVKLANINHRLGYGNNAINLCNFYPIMCMYKNGDFVCDLYNANGDPFFSDVADYFVTIVYPNSYLLASSGIQNKTTKKDASCSTQITAKCVRDFAMVLSNKTKLETKKYDDRINIKYYYYDDEKFDKSIQLIEQVLKFFETKIGRYPYKEISVVKTNFVHGGMEYPNIVLISDNLSDYKEHQMVIVHELCHQWWYGVVGNNQFDDGWIDEGLTEFCTVYFFDNHKEYNQTMQNMVKASTNAYVTFSKVYKDVLGSVDTSMNRPLNKFDTEPEYVYNTYVKGMLMFATIYELVGTKNFDNALKYYYKQNMFKIVSPSVLIKCFSIGSGKNLEGLINSWLNGKVVIVN